MEAWLPFTFACIMGLALLTYVILDGYDLGIGILLPFGTPDDRDLMIASIGPFWDANETWIVLGIGILLIAFPKAHGLILTSLYLPVAIMLIALTLRGVAFDLRVKAGSDKRDRWDRLFFAGSLVASLAQGWMLGDYVTGLSGSTTSILFAALIALTLPALYVMLGTAWLMIKARQALFDKAIGWARIALWPMALALLLVSIATPVASPEIAAKWFSLPNAIGLLPIPLTCILCLATIFWLLRRPDAMRRGAAVLMFVALVSVCMMSAIGLAFSLYPYIVLGQITIAESAAAPASLRFTLVGLVITLPVIIGYTIFVYRVFRGPADELNYE